MLQEDFGMERGTHKRPSALDGIFVRLVCNQKAAFEIGAVLLNGVVMTYLVTPQQGWLQIRCYDLQNQYMLLTRNHRSVHTVTVNTLFVNRFS